MMFCLNFEHIFHTPLLEGRYAAEAYVAVPRSALTRHVALLAARR